MTTYFDFYDSWTFSKLNFSHQYWLCQSISVLVRQLWVQTPDSRAADSHQSSMINYCRHATSPPDQHFCSLISSQLLDENIQSVSLVYDIKETTKLLLQASKQLFFLWENIMLLPSKNSKIWYLKCLIFLVSQMKFFLSVLRDWTESSD